MYTRNECACERNDMVYEAREKVPDVGAGSESLRHPPGLASRILDDYTIFFL